MHHTQALITEVLNRPRPGCQIGHVVAHAFEYQLNGFENRMSKPQPVEALSELFAQAQWGQLPVKTKMQLFFIGFKQDSKFQNIVFKMPRTPFEIT